MKVMHVITGLRIGGAENQLPLLTRHSRTDASVVALTNADEIADVLRSEGVPVHELGMGGNRDVAAVARLASLMSRERPDVVHLHLFRAMVYGRVAARLARVPAVVTTEHSLLGGQLEGRRATQAIRGLYLATEPLSNATIAVSDEVAKCLVSWGVSAHKVHVVPNAVDFAALRSANIGRSELRRELQIPLDAEVVGGIGRLSPTKRWDLLIRALAADLGPLRHLILAGSGQQETALRRLAESFGLSAWVHMIGSRLDLPSILAAMDVVASTSPQETFGLALVEAAAAGRPVIYVHCPALEEIGSVRGVARVPADAPLIRGAILAALRDRAPVAPSAALGRYDVVRVSGQVDAVYQESLQLHRRRRQPR